MVMLARTFSASNQGDDHAVERAPCWGLSACAGEAPHRLALFQNRLRKKLYDELRMWAD